jgi:spatacsin
MDTSDLLHRKTSEFLESSLSVTFDQWPLVLDLIRATKLTPAEVSASLAVALNKHVSAVLSGEPLKPGQLEIDDFSSKFSSFTNLCEVSKSVGESLLNFVKPNRESLKLTVAVNLVLHASVSTPDVDECATLLDSMLPALSAEGQTDSIIQIVSIFPDPALLPRFFDYLVAHRKLDSLSHSVLSDKVGRVIMNCARHADPFEPEQYFELTLKYQMYRDHAELQMECGNRIMAAKGNGDWLQKASRHFLFAVSYFLHEKCYNLAMQCLKKLSLISMQLEVTENFIGLDKSQVLSAMQTREFPVAITLAVAYDLDDEQNWAEALYRQVIVNNNVKEGREFLDGFEKFRSLTRTLADAIVQKFVAANKPEDQAERVRFLLESMSNLVERFQVAKSFGFADVVDAMKEKFPVVCEWCEVLASR